MKKRPIVLIVVGCLLLTGAAGLSGYNLYQDHSAKKEADKLLYGLEDYMLDNIDSELVNEADSGTMASTNVNGIDLAGTLSIPAIDIEVPVAEEWSYKNLKKAACRYSGTIQDENLIILAHNYKRHFGYLKTLKEGDEIKFLDVNGALYNYRVAETEILEKYQLDELTNTEYDMTLFTCTYGGERRVVVRCNRTGDDQ